MAKIPNVCLALSNRPENVLVVRQALAGVADCLALGVVEANDLKTAVTEACNNVVLHAYDGGRGPLEVDVCVLAGAVSVIVRDRGRGIGSRELGAEQIHTGIGLSVIRELSRHTEFRSLEGGGTEVCMELAVAKATLLALPRGDGPALHRPTQLEPVDTVRMSLAPSILAREVLPRVLSALAARAYFSTERIADIQLVADALVASAGDSISASHLDVSVTLAPRSLELRVGPLHAGHGESLLAAAADGLAPVVARLTDGSHQVLCGDSAETLALRLVEGR